MMKLIVGLMTFAMVFSVVTNTEARGRHHDNDRHDSVSIDVEVENDLESAFGIHPARRMDPTADFFEGVMGSPETDEGPIAERHHYNISRPYPKVVEA